MLRGDINPAGVNAELSTKKGAVSTFISELVDPAEVVDPVEVDILTVVVEDAGLVIIGFGTLGTLLITGFAGTDFTEPVSVFMVVVPTVVVAGLFIGTTCIGTGLFETVGAGVVVFLNHENGLYQAALATAGTAIESTNKDMTPAFI